MVNLNTKRILVPFDFSDTAENAVKNAAFIAALTKGELYIIYVQKKNELFDILLPALNVKSLKVVTNVLNEKLTSEAARITKHYSVKVTPILSHGKIANEIIKAAEKNNINLIVMGTHGSASHNDLFMGSNTYRTVSKSNLPVLTIASTPEKKGYSNILLPIDLSTHTRQKVNAAIQLAKLFSGHLHIVGMYDNDEKTLKYKLEVYLEQILKLCKKNKVLATSYLSKTDNNLKKTLQFIKNVNADIVISMTDQNGETKTLLLGNYIHQLINNSKVPVLCLKPEVNDEVDSDTPGVPY